MSENNFWSEIDKEIINFDDGNCFFEDDFMNLSPKISKQFEHLSDHNEYIRCLENKLNKLKGTDSKKSASKKSKELIESLVSVRQDTMINLLTEKSTERDNQFDEISNYLNEEAIADDSYLKKQTYSVKQEMTIEEQLQLLKADYLAKKSELESNDNTT